jgi:23S rRNA (adenine2030-N6)-methyltransferase
VTLIDPPFEVADELERMSQGLTQALQRFATGVFLAWYPIKDPKRIARFHARLAAICPLRLMRVELMTQRPINTERLNGCGLIVANPPFTLEEDMAAVLPDLSRRLTADGGGAGYHLDWINPASAKAPRPASGVKDRMRPSR